MTAGGGVEEFDFESAYWRALGGIHGLREAANNDGRHGQVSTKHMLQAFLCDNPPPLLVAIAELIAADREYDEANAACRGIGAEWNAWTRVHEATARRASALAAVGQQ